MIWRIGICIREHICIYCWIWPYLISLLKIQRLSNWYLLLVINILSKIALFSLYLLIFLILFLSLIINNFLMLVWYKWIDFRIIAYNLWWRNKRISIYYWILGYSYILWSISIYNRYITLLDSVYRWIHWNIWLWSKWRICWWDNIYCRCYIWWMYSIMTLYYIWWAHLTVRTYHRINYFILFWKLWLICVYILTIL